MAYEVDLKNVVKHIVDGTLDQNLCRVCLVPLGEVCENIFTKVCKDGKEFCVADVLGFLCDVKLSEDDDSNVCSNCFIMATAAYKFYLLSKRSEEILHFYVDELEKHVDSVQNEMAAGSNDNFCITLPIVEPSIDYLDYDLNGCLSKLSIEYLEEADDNKKPSIKNRVVDTIVKPVKKGSRKRKGTEMSEDLVVVIENGVQTVYKMRYDGTLKQVSDGKPKLKLPTNATTDKGKIRRRHRDPMEFHDCSKCPVRYRFLSKMKMHMKVEHDIDLFVCKVCKALIEGEKEFNLHLETHSGIHRCNLCNMVFKKRDTIIAHLKWHEEMKNMSKLEGAHICEICGDILPNEDQLKDHYDKKHDKKYTCFYCGRMYKGELSFETHIKKHEQHIKSKKTEENNGSGEDSQEEKTDKKEKSEKKRVVCPTCGKHFVDDRSLMWHSMLHTNERPYSCDVCGRAFVSVNRRNQHVTCAHTMPTKRCPLCPALFHMRSMINTHIKKVHLKTFRRRHRSSKHQNVSWRTEVVPIQDLSVSIQNEILEMKTNQEDLLSPNPDDPGFEWVISTEPYQHPS